jgi:CHAT domain-containing protein
MVASEQPGAVLLTRDEATADAFRRMAAGYGMIHLAAPSELDPLAPLESRILLAPTRTSSGDVSVYDLFGLRLDADLVVLSACHADPVPGALGDELIGLYRGFFYAGAGGIVASLWPVEDEASGFLMQRLYREMDAGSTPAEALRAAQLATMERYPHPFYWAPFQYTGVSEA